ncbi:uncharacterized protein CANTADRAFT_27581, partial [Suhomyces tanzawaensis NRRL Y-17324]
MIQGRLLNPIGLANTIGRLRISTVRPVRFFRTQYHVSSQVASYPITLTHVLKNPFGTRKYSSIKQSQNSKTSEEVQAARQSPNKITSENPVPDLVEQTSKALTNNSIYTVPNILTFTRIISAPFIGYFIVNGNTQLALLLFLYSCITDFIDGYIARKWNLKSVLGSIIDPLADKLLMTVCTLSLAYINSIPTLVASLIIGRDVMLSFMSFYYRYKTLPPPKTLGRFLDISKNETISVHPNMLGKVNTGLQMVYIGGLVFKPVVENLLMTDLELYFQGMGILVSVTTVLSGLSYVFNNKSVKFL